MSEQTAHTIRVPGAAETAAILRAERRMLAALEARMEVQQAREQRRNLATVALLRLRAILKDVDIESAEGFCAALRVAWGAWLVLPMTTFASSPVFRSMSGVAPEWLWGLVVLGSGVLSLAVLLIGSRRWRLGAMIGGAVTWGGLSGLFFWASPENVTSVIYPMLTSLSIWAFLRLAYGRGGRWAS